MDGIRDAVTLISSLKSYLLFAVIDRRFCRCLVKVTLFIVFIYQRDLQDTMLPFAHRRKLSQEKDVSFSRCMASWYRSNSYDARAAEEKGKHECQFHGTIVNRR